jgi:hypothetical protein
MALEGIPRLVVTFGDLTRVLEATTENLREGIDLANKTQKASLALGMNLTATRTKLGTSLDDLRGSINQKMVAGFEMLEAGFQGNNKGVAKLINQQMLTGTAYKGTAKAFIGLERIAGLGKDATNELAERTIKLGKIYGVSTDEMVKSLDSFKDQFADLNLLGMGEGFLGAVGELKAKLGPEFHSSIDSIAKMFVQTGTKGLDTMATLGLSDFRDQAQLVGKDQAASIALLEKALVKANASLALMTGGANTTSLSLGNITDQLGSNLSTLKPLAEAITSGFRHVNDEQTHYAEQISTFIDEVWNPLKTTMMGLVVVTIPLFRKASEFLVEKLQMLTAWVKETFVKFGGLVGIVDKIKTVFEFLKPALIGIGAVLLVASIPFIATFTKIAAAVTIVTTGLWLLGKVIKGVIGFLGFKFLQDSPKVSADQERLNRKRDLDSQAKRNQKADDAFNKRLKLDADFFGVAEDQLRETKDINRKTPDAGTGSSFLEQTTLLLSENMDRILGIAPRDEHDLFVDIRDNLEEINESTMETANKRTGVGTHINSEFA